MTFTSDQREAFQSNGTVPISIDGIDCFIVRADIFERVRAVLTDELSHDELRALLSHSAHGSDWMDPAMDIYDHYDEQQ